MKNIRKLVSQFSISLVAMLLLAVAPAVASAQGANNPQLQKKVRHELVTLPY